MNFFNLQMFGDGEPTYTTTNPTYSTVSPTYTSITPTNTTATPKPNNPVVIVLDGKTLVDEETFTYGLEMMRSYAKKHFLPKSNLTFMKKADIDALFAKWEAEDAAQENNNNDDENDDTNSTNDNP